MEHRTFGDADLSCSVLGFGTWELGTDKYGEVDRREAVRAVEIAIDRGITLFDTAEVYGPFHSEELLARGLGNRRKDVVVVTKVGFVFHDNARGLGENVAAADWRLSADDRTEVDRIFAEEGVDTYVDATQAWPLMPPRGESMKITRFETIVLDNIEPYRGGKRWLFLKLFTDEGLVGLGERPSGNAVDLTAQARLIEALCEQFVVGANPFDITSSSCGRRSSPPGTTTATPASTPPRR